MRSGYDNAIAVHVFDHVSLLQSSAPEQLGRPIILIVLVLLFIKILFGL